MPKLFSYGTLQQANVQLETFGRLLTGEPDALPGYRREMVRMTGADHHPIVLKSTDPADAVAGAVFEITDTELSAADEYEVDDYKRVAVRLRSGIEAWVYVKA